MGIACCEKKNKEIAEYKFKIPDLDKKRKMNEFGLINPERYKNKKFDMNAILIIQKFIREYLKKKKESKLKKAHFIYLFKEIIDSMQTVSTNQIVSQAESNLLPLELPEPSNDQVKRIFTPNILILDNGEKYKGYINAETQEKDGFGIQIWMDGSKYVGYWKLNKANGFGRFIYADGDAYEGYFKDGKKNKYGIYSNFDGGKYSGYWKNDLQHGKVTETLSDGGKYEGEYEEGKKQGKGKFTWTDGSYYYGSYLNNAIHGDGTLVWSDGRKYVGTLVNNKMEGKGTFTWPDGRKYYGDFKDDKRNGKGEFYWPGADGKKYIGNWENGKQQGKGILYCGNKPRVGEWNCGKIEKWIGDFTEN